MLDVAVAAEADAGEEDLFLVGDAVAIRVGEEVEIVVVGDVHEDPVLVERQHVARRRDVVDEHGMLVEDAVALGALPAADPVALVELTGGIAIEHVGAHLADVHAAVAVELDQARLLDFGIRGHQLHAETGGELKGLGLLGGGFGLDGVARREIGVLVALGRVRVGTDRGTGGDRCASTGRGTATTTAGRATPGAAAGTATSRRGGLRVSGQHVARTGRYGATGGGRVLGQQ